MAVCTSCGQENPPIAKFCLACGAPLAAEEAPSEERRLVTAVFTDVVGSTAAAEDMDPEDVHRRLQPYFDRVRRELQRYGGTLEKYIGDAVVAIFGAPVAHEDDPERAVRAALAIRDAIEDLNASDAWLDLSIRVGVNTGETLLLVGSNPSLEFGMAVGDAMNTAARIQSAAPVNGVLVGELTYEATREAIEYEQAESIVAKGKSEPVPVWIAVRPRERGLARHGQLVGREPELEQLLAVWNAVRDERRPGLAVVTGLPGIGKSGLLHEFVTRVATDGASHWGACLPYGEGITYWPVMEIVKDAAGILQSDDGEAIRARLGALIESLAIDDTSELRTIAAAVSNLLDVPTTPRGTYQAAEITQSELHWGIRRILQVLARERPTALVFEDLHWAEPTLIELMKFLLEGEDVPLLVVASARPEALEQTPELAREGPRSRVLRLEGLTEEAGRALLRELLESDELAESPVAATLLRTAGGNPLFLSETVAALRDAGLLDEQGWHLPEDATELPTPTSLQGLIGARLDQLGRPEKRVAQAASVVGSVFWAGAVDHLQEHAANQNSDLVGQIRTLEGRDLVHQHDISSVDGELEFEFKHILIRDVAYGQLPKGRRVELHMRFAEWMHALPIDEFVEIVAWHLERACTLAREVARSPVEPPIDEAVAALSAAAEKAERREGLREAQRYYTRALDLVDEESEAAMELRVPLARALFRGGQVQRAEELALSARDAAMRAGRMDLVAAALITLWSIAYGKGRVGDANDRLTEVQPLVSQLGDVRLQIRTAYALGATKADLEAAAEEGLAQLARGLSIAEEVDDLALRVEGHLRTGFILQNIGQLDRAEKEFSRCASLAMELGSTRDEARATMPLAYIKYLRGDLDEAEQLGEQTRAWFERTGETFFQIQNLIALAQYALARDEPIVAEERLREALPIALAEKSFLVGEIYRLLTETLITLDRLDDATELAAFAVRGTEDEHPYSRAAVLMAGAMVATATRDLEAAARGYQEAIALLEDLELPIELAAARLAYGRALGDVGRFEAAQTQLNTARETLERVGATGLLGDVDEELALIAQRAGPV